jgi:hypothetical protein
MNEMPMFSEALFVRHNINEFREHGHLVHRADTRGAACPEIRRK